MARFHELTLPPYPFVWQRKFATLLAGVAQQAMFFLKTGFQE